MRGDSGVAGEGRVVSIPYTRVNKRIRLFPKLQGNMRLIPNMHLIMKGKIRPHPKTTTPLVSCAHDSVYTMYTVPKFLDPGVSAPCH